MKKLFWSIVALASAFVSLLPGVCQAGKNLNHNQALLRAKIFALAAAALISMLPSVSEAGRSLNHSQTTLRG